MTCYYIIIIVFKIDAALIKKIKAAPWFLSSAAHLHPDSGLYPDSCFSLVIDLSVVNTSTILLFSSVPILYKSYHKNASRQR